MDRRSTLRSNHRTPYYVCVPSPGQSLRLGIWVAGSEISERLLSGGGGHNACRVSEKNGHAKDFFELAPFCAKRAYWRESKAPDR